MADHEIDPMLLIEQRIKLAFKGVTEEIIEQETRKALDRVRHRISKEVTRLVLDIENWYEIRMRENTIVIEVRRKDKEEDNG
jgi:hypothetical protein